MSRTHRFVWPRRRSRALASTLVALLAIPALVPAAGAQAEVEIGVSDEGVEVSANGTVTSFDMGVAIEGGSVMVGGRLTGLRSVVIEGSSATSGGEFQYTVVVSPIGGESLRFTVVTPPVPPRTD